MAKTKIRWVPGEWIGYSLLVSLLGGLVAGVLTAINTQVGMIAIAIVGSVAGAMFLIGVIGQGVLVGMREVRHEQLLAEAKADMYDQL